MIHIKRIGFLFVMALMGVTFLILHYSGYLLGWRLYTDNSYWFPIAYSVNILLMAASVFFIFWICRHFLFGRGRPWFAWFCILSWVLVWGIVISKDVTQSTAVWTSSIYFGPNTLSTKAEQVQKQVWSITMAEITELPIEQRERICTYAILNGGGGRTEGQSEGIPLQFNLPEDMIGKGLMETQICPSVLVQKFKKLKDLSLKFNDVLTQKGYSDNISKQESINEKVYLPSQLYKNSDGVKGLITLVNNVTIYREELRVNLHNAMMEKKICSSDLVQRFKKLKDSRIKLYLLLTQENYIDSAHRYINIFEKEYFKMRLLSHPDALTKISTIVQEYKNKPIDLHIAINEMSLRNITTEAQHEHVWIKMEGLNNDQIKTVSIDPRIWPASDDFDDSWFFWKKTESIDGNTAIEIDQMKCEKEL